MFLTPELPPDAAGLAVDPNNSSTVPRSAGGASNHCGSMFNVVSEFKPLCSAIFCDIVSSVATVGVAAPRKEVKRAFLLRSQEFHPDLFFNEKDEDLKRQVTTIYKRVAEA